MISRSRSYELLTARELATYVGRLHGLARPALRARVDEMVDVFGIQEFANRWCGRLSTEQRQRVSRALVHDPPTPLWLIPLGVIAFTLGARMLERVVPRSLGTGGRTG